MNQKLIPFDIEKAKAGAKVVTRSGNPVRILCYDAMDDKNIIGLVRSSCLESLEKSWAWSASGRHINSNVDSAFDLFILSELKWREWRRSDAPLGAVIRNKVADSRDLLIEASENNVCLGNGRDFTYEYLLKHGEWKWPHEPEDAWRTCGVEGE